jgi:hypothetical protein
MLRIILLCLLSLPARAADLAPELFMPAYVLAFVTAGYEPARLPVVRMVPRAQMCQMIGWPETCPVRGLTSDDGTVYLDERLRLTDPHDSAIMVHELAHYVDFMRWGPPQDCEAWLQREERAYALQIHALRLTGSDTQAPMLAFRSLKCS